MCRFPGYLICIYSYDFPLPFLLVHNTSPTKFSQILRKLSVFGNFSPTYTYAMVLGVKINKNDMETLRSAIKRVEVNPEDKEQIQKAFENYKSNGEGWNFDCGYSGSSQILSSSSS